MSQFRKAYIRVGEGRINPAHVVSWQPEASGEIDKTRVFYTGHTDTNPATELLDCTPEEFDGLMENAT